MRLDNLDIQILRLLSTDSRMQYKDIARKLHVSIPTVKSRVERLKELGIIKKFTILVDKSKLSENTQAVLLFKVAPQFLSSVVDNLKKVDEIRELYITSGRYDIIAKIEVSSLRDISLLLSDKLSTVEGINDLECVVVVEVGKEDTTPIIKEGTALNIRCDFCKAIIVEKPVVEYIGGGKYYFSSPACAEAFKQKLRKSNKNTIMKVG